MTIEELKEILDTEEGKGLLGDLGYKAAEDIKGLENKKNELLAEIAKKNKSIKAFQTLLDSAGVDTPEALAEKLAGSTDKGEADTQIERMQKQLDQLTKANRESEERLTREKTRRAESEKRQRIRAALEKSNVDNDALDVVEQYFSSRALVIDEENGKIGVVVDTDDGQSPIESVVDAWSKTDQAKRFIKAVPNRGGGSLGPGRGGSGKTLSLDEIEKMPNREDRLKALKEIGVANL